MDNKKKTDSIMRYVVYLLCGVLLAGYSLLKWNAMSEMKYLYLAIGVIWVIYGGVRALLPSMQRNTGLTGLPTMCPAICGTSHRAPSSNSVPSMASSWQSGIPCRSMPSTSPC